MPENLKNVLLVMNASGFLVPPWQGATEDQRRLWTTTFERIDPVLPTIKDDIFPPPSSPSSAPSSAEQEAGTTVTDPQN